MEISTNHSRKLGHQEPHGAPDDLVTSFVTEQQALNRQNNLSNKVVENSDEEPSRDGSHQGAAPVHHNELYSDRDVGPVSGKGIHQLFSFAHAQPEPIGAEPGSQKRRRAPTPDDSLISFAESSVVSEAEATGNRRLEFEGEKIDNQKTRNYKRQPRRKIREPADRTKPLHPENKLPAKRAKRGGRGRVPGRMDALVEGFRPATISDRRLTLRPTHKLGIFRNGRASNSVPLRGLPDLTFCELDFLHRKAPRKPLRSRYSRLGMQSRYFSKQNCTPQHDSSAASPEESPQAKMLKPALPRPVPKPTCVPFAATSTKKRKAFANQRPNPAPTRSLPYLAASSPPRKPAPPTRSEQDWYRRPRDGVLQRLDDSSTSHRTPADYGSNKPREFESYDEGSREHLLSLNKDDLQTAYAIQESELKLAATTYSDLDRYRGLRDCALKRYDGLATVQNAPEGLASSKPKEFKPNDGEDGGRVLFYHDGSRNAHALQVGDLRAAAPTAFGLDWYRGPRGGVLQRCNDSPTFYNASADFHSNKPSELRSKHEEHVNRILPLDKDDFRKPHAVQKGLLKPAAPNHSDLGRYRETRDSVLQRFFDSSASYNAPAELASNRPRGFKYNDEENREHILRLYEDDRQNTPAVQKGELKPVAPTHFGLNWYRAPPDGVLPRQGDPSALYNSASPKFASYEPRQFKSKVEENREHKLHLYKDDVLNAHAIEKGRLKPATPTHSDLDQYHGLRDGVFQRYDGSTTFYNSPADFGSSKHKEFKSKHDENKEHILRLYKVDFRNARGAHDGELKPAAPSYSDFGWYRRPRDGALLRYDNSSTFYNALADLAPNKPWECKSKDEENRRHILRLYENDIRSARTVREGELKPAASTRYDLDRYYEPRDGVLQRYDDSLTFHNASTGFFSKKPKEFKSEDQKEREHILRLHGGGFRNAHAILESKLKPTAHTYSDLGRYREPRDGVPQPYDDSSTFYNSPAGFASSGAGESRPKNQESTDNILLSKDDTRNDRSVREVIGQDKRRFVSPVYDPRDGFSLQASYDVGRQPTGTANIARNSRPEALFGHHLAVPPFVRPKNVEIGIELPKDFWKPQRW